MNSANNTIEIDTSYVVEQTTGKIIVDTRGNNVAIYLMPLGISSGDGKLVIVKKYPEDKHNISLITQNSHINGDDAIIFGRPGRQSHIALKHDGINWTSDSK